MEAKEPKYGGIVVAVQEIQIRLKKMIIEGVRRGEPERETKARCKKFIDDYCDTLWNAEYRERSRAALYRSFAKWYRKTARIFWGLPFVVLLAYKKVPREVMAEARIKAERLPRPVIVEMQEELRTAPFLEYGKEYADAEYQKRMNEAFGRYVDRLADSEAKYDRNVSLRNLAEIETRRREIDDMIADFQRRGVRLVWASSHADASERCTPWQGRLYSLDGTSGVINGIPFIPLQTAVNVRDKYGNINGLFGYNCRHHLTEYRENERAPYEYTVSEMRRERKIDARQRAMERTIRKWKTRGFCAENKDFARAAFLRARQWEQEYEKYSRENGRAFFQNRTRVMRNEIAYYKAIKRL